MSEMRDRLSAILSAADDEAPMPTYDDVAYRLLVAMREPTAEMVNATFPALAAECYRRAQQGKHTYVPTREKLRLRWRAMIDEATGLREAPREPGESPGKVDTPPTRSASALHVLGRVGSARADTGGREDVLRVHGHDHEPESGPCKAGENAP